MTEHPILFTTPMVRAIIAGKKTQTRRLSGLADVNEKPDIWTFRGTGVLGYMAKPSVKGRFGAYFDTEKLEPRTMNICPQLFPYGGVGSRLWVREAWSLSGNWDGVKISELPLMALKTDIVYRADEKYPDAGYYNWKPSIFMPRLASRILLEITDIRVERVKDISEKDAQAEGITTAWHGGAKEKTYIGEYSILWDEINRAGGNGWEKNPFVWCISFQVVNNAK